MNIKEDTSRKIKNMSIVCAILVVVIHVGWPSNSVSLTWVIQQFVKDGVARIAVPFFFVISGFFLSKHMNDRGWYGVELKKRVESLVVPFALWTLIAITLLSPLAVISNVAAHRPWGGNLGFSSDRILEVIGLDIRHVPMRLGALWYVRCLFLFVVIAPVFKWFVLRGRVAWLACVFALALAHASWHHPSLREIFDYGFSLSGAFYFSLGIYIGIFKIRIPKSRLLFGFSCMIGMSLLIANAMLSYFAIVLCVSLTTVAIPFVMYAVWRLIPTQEWPSALTACSFPIFLMHQILLPYFSLPIKYSPLRDSQVGSVLVFSGVLLSSFSLAIMIRKVCPRANAVLFAGRN